MKQFEGYEEYLKQSELSKQTRQVYLREAEKFVRYLNGKEITKDRTMLYREKLREEDLSPATPSAEELDRNPRSRSAKLRAAVKR